MSIRKQIESELDQIQRSDQGGEIVATAPGAEVRVSVREAGPIGVAVDHIRVRREKMNAAGAHKACERAQEQVKYLLEPLRVLEVDEEAGVTQARSAQPTRDERGRHYYELTGRPGELDLRRYCKPDSDTRQAEPMELTREQLGRLADDLQQAAKQDAM